MLDPLNKGQLGPHVRGSVRILIKSYSHHFVYALAFGTISNLSNIITWPKDKKGRIETSIFNITVKSKLKIATLK